MIEKQFAGRRRGKTSVLGGVQDRGRHPELHGLEVGQRRHERHPKVDESLGAEDPGPDVRVRRPRRDRRPRHAGTAARGADRQAAARAQGRGRALKAKIFKNMSQRAAEMLKDDLEAKGPVRLSEVEAAQKEILLAVRKMADAGTIQLGGKGEEYV